MLGIFRLLLAVGVALAHLTLLTAGTARSLVAAFFVISGYLMALTLTRNYAASAGRLAFPGAFYWNRFLRIYPLHICLSMLVIAGVLTGLLRLPGPLPSAPAILASLTLFHDHSDLLVAPAWSLFYEVIFYAFAPLLVLGAGRVALAAAGLCLASLAWQGKVWYVVEPFMLHGTIFDVSVALPTAGLLFLLGLGLYLLKQRLQLIVSSGRGLQIATLVALGGLGAVTLVPLYGPDAVTFDARYGRAVYLAVIALTAVLLVAWDERREMPWSTWAGDLCYPVYMIHWPVFMYLEGGYGVVNGLALTFAAAYGWLALERRSFAKLRRRQVSAPSDGVAVPHEAARPASASVTS